MSDRNEITKELDTLIDEYHSVVLPLPRLIEVRRAIAVFSYRLAAHVKEVYGKAGLGYARRKFEIAQSIVSARNVDAKAALGFLEHAALKTPSVMAAQETEIWAEAEKEELTARLRAINNVLNSLTQEIAELRSEKNSTHHQNVGE